MAMNLNSLLLETLSSRLGPVTDPALQALLSGTNSAETSGGLPSVQELLSQLESTNPTAGLIAKYFTARQASLSENSTENEIEATEEAVSAEEPQHLAFEESRYLEQVVQHLEWRVKNVRTELDQLRQRNDTLAAALGACYLCWGDDSNCPNCQGSGSPGSLMPARKLYVQLVVPASRRFQNGMEVNNGRLKNNPSNTSAKIQTMTKGEQNE